MTLVVGLAGWSGAGKTTLLSRLIPVLVARGLRVATIKHAHHAFDVDQEGKDSWIHRAAGADSVLVCSARRWALMHELRGAPEPGLPELLGRLPAADLVLVEGFKRGPHPRLEVFRAANGKPPLHPDDPGIAGLVSDRSFPESGLPAVSLDDVDGAAALALDIARPAATMTGVDLLPD
jgi:molybdopterin-guanine dinucleotide biosynthesis protein B